MKSSTVTKLSLWDFARIMQINPLHLGQVVYIPDGQRSTLCDQAFYQYDYQDANRIGRESISIAIAEAEALLERYLGFRLAPSWEVDEWQPVEPYWRPGVFGDSIDLRGQGIAVKAKWGHFISGGIRSKELVAGAAPIVWTDIDGDGYSETATVTVPTEPIDYSCELKVYYPGYGGNDEYEIRPVRASIDTVLSMATITFRREQTVRLELMESMYPEPVRGEDDDSFITTVDVYRVYNDPQRQVSFLWEPWAGGSCAYCGGGGCSVCAYASQAGCLHLRGNPRNSMVVPSPADWDNTDLSFHSTGWASWRRPDLVRLYYYSGLRDKNQVCVSDMDEQWKRTVAHFAASMLDRGPCNCGIATWEYWREDQGLVNGSDGSGNQRGTYRLHLKDLECPFGTRRGALDAWRRIRHKAIVPAAVPI